MLQIHFCQNFEAVNSSVYLCEAWAPKPNWQVSLNCQPNYLSQTIKEAVQFHFRFDRCEFASLWQLSESKWLLWVGPVSVHSAQKRGTCAGLNFVSAIDGKRCHWFTLANSHTFPCRWCFPWCVDPELGQVTRLAKRRWGMRSVCGACQQQHKLLEVWVPTSPLCSRPLCPSPARVKPSHRPGQEGSTAA